MCHALSRVKAYSKLEIQKSGRGLGSFWRWKERRRNLCAVAVVLGGKPILRTGSGELWSLFPATSAGIGDASSWVFGNWGRGITVVAAEQVKTHLRPSGPVLSFRSLWRWCCSRWSPEWRTGSRWPPRCRRTNRWAARSPGPQVPVRALCSQHGIPP